MCARIKCLALDHDDTVVMSSPDIHYPSFVEAMRLLRPERAGMGFDEFIAYSCAPGIQALLTDVLCLNAEEMRVQQSIWRRYTRTRTPDAYPGFTALFASFRTRGGHVAVISHSERELFGFEPDLVFGWEQPEARRKPHPWPLEETLRVLGLRPEEALLVDDLSPGFAMAAAWAGAATYFTVARCRSLALAFPWRHSQERTISSNTPSPRWARPKLDRPSSWSRGMCRSK